VIFDAHYRLYKGHLRIPPAHNISAIGRKT
jgi:hypothetical protein